MEKVDLRKNDLEERRLEKVNLNFNTQAFLYPGTLKNKTKACSASKDGRVITKISLEGTLFKPSFMLVGW